MAEKYNFKVPDAVPVDLSRLPLKLPKITVDQTKCTVPFWCKKCFEACQNIVFSTYCRKPERLKEADPRQPGVYGMLAVRRDKCNLCNKCIDVCPENAITITY